MAKPEEDFHLEMLQISHQAKEHHNYNAIHWAYCQKMNKGENV